MEKSKIKKQKSKNYKYLAAFFLILNLLLSAPFCFAADIKFDVAVDKKTVSLDSTVNLNLNFYGAQDIINPDLPDIKGFDWRYLGPSTRMSIINGRVSSSITHMYILIPEEVGEFAIPPLSVYYRGRVYRSQAIPIEVVRGAIAAPPQEAEKEDYEDEIRALKNRLFITMEAGKTNVYVNEIIPVTIRLYVNRLGVRDIQYPEFAHEGFSIDEFAEPKQYRDVIRGDYFDIIEFKTNAFATRYGELKLGPAELKCNLLVRERKRPFPSMFDDDFFGRSNLSDFFAGYKRYPVTLTSPDITITAKELPGGNVPPDFTGAIGNYQFSLQVDPREVKVGDPITLKMAIAGEGNLKTVQLPKLKAANDFKIYDPEIKQDATGKTFEQVVIPKHEGVTEIPEITFSFFDTESVRYRTITRGPVPIKVNPLPRGEELKIFETPEGAARAAEKREILGRDIIYIKDSPGRLTPKDTFLFRNRLFVAFQFIPLLAVIFVSVLKKRRTRLATDIRYARRLRAPHKARKNLLNTRKLLNSGEPNKFYEAVFKTLQEYLGDKFHLPTAGITSTVAEELRARGINEEILARLKECFENCDMARYAPSTVIKEDMQKTFELLGRVIDGLERTKS